MRTFDGYLPTIGHQHTIDEDNDHQKHDPLKAADMELLHKIAAVVDFHYLGQPFMIEVSHKQGVVKIQIPALMREYDWFVVPIRYLHSDPGFRHIIRGCGEILERFNIPRAKFDRDHYVNALNFQFGRS